MAAKSKAAQNMTSEQQKVSWKLPNLEMPLRTSLLYLLFGILWILLTDQILAFFVPSDPQQAIYQTLKGWFFILVSGILLYFLLRKDLTRREQTEKALHASEELYRLITQNSQDLIWTMNLDLQLTYVSPTVERVLGYPAKEILASSPERFLIPESDAARLAVLTEEIEKAQPQSDPDYARVLELECRRKDGSTFWVEMKFSSFRDENDKPIGVLGIGRDITERKQTEAQKKILMDERDEYYRRIQLILEHMPIGCDMTDLDFNLIYWNRAAESIFGFSAAEVLGKQPYGLFIPEEARPYVEEVRQKMISQHIPIFAKNKNLTKDGRLISCEWHNTPMLDAQGNLAGFLGMVQDVTERERSDAELSASEERFRLLFEENHAVMMLIEPVSGAIRNANKAAAEFYGYPLAELRRMNINDINMLTPEDVQRERMRALQEERNFFSFQHRLASGEIRPVEVHSAPIEWDGQTLLFSIVHDITERKQAEGQIRRQLKHMSALRMIDIAISSSFDLHVILDVILQQVLSQLGVDASAVLLINPQLQTIEYTASRGFYSSTLQSIQLKLGEGYAGRVVLERKTVHISALLEAGGKLAKALQLAHEGFVDFFGAPLMVKGEVKGVLEIYHRSHLRVDSQWLEFLEALAGQAAIAIDNAQLFETLQRSNFNLERRVAERTAELNQINVELERANRVKDEFLANMSHELRTPLTSILGLSESLLEQRRGLLNDHQQRSLEVIEASGQHLLELINDILDLSKIEAGKFDYYPQPILVDEICRSSLSFIKSQAAKKSIAITYIEDPAVSKIYADPRRLKQILVNLLNNAVKFTLENGHVILQVSSDLEQDLINFSVIDDGIGISPENLGRLFQPFVQVDSSLNRQHEGTGLGLALVQKLTDLHGGSVQVESEPGKGSRFTISLPCLQDEMRKLEKLELQLTFPASEPTLTSDLSAERPEQRGLILLADDNMPSILTIGEYMESLGYEVIAAHDGLEAVQKAEAFKPDIILMDIQMPSMNGLEAIARLRGTSRFLTTPIIALTALTMPGDRERSLLAGANEYMSKPVNLKNLAKTIETMLKSEKGILH